MIVIRRRYRFVAGVPEQRDSLLHCECNVIVVVLTMCGYGRVAGYGQTQARRVIHFVWGVFSFPPGTRSRIGWGKKIREAIELIWVEIQDIIAVAE